MEFIKITVGGFRNLKNIELKFDNILAFVALNSYGKSNLLNAVDFGIDFIKNDQKVKKEMMSWRKGIPLNKKMAYDDFIFEVEMQTEVENKKYIVIYGYKFRWLRDDGTGARILEEWLKVKLDEKNQKFNNYITRSESKAYYRTSESGRCNNNINVESNELIINKLKAYDFIYYSEIVKGINNLNMYIERRFDVSSLYTRAPIIRTDIEVLNIGGSQNIPRIIFHLKKEFPERYELLKNSFMLLFPNITDISVDEVEIKSGFEFNIPDKVPLKLDNRFYSLHVIDKNINQPINFESISDGAKRVFLVLTTLLLADINAYSLIAIEEPENSIHPSLLQKYLRVVSQFINKCKVIITSHSPYIIQYLDPNNVYIGLPNIHGTAEFFRIRQSAKKSIISDAGSLSMTTGDYIFELLSGTHDDIASIQQYLEGNKHE